MTIGEDCAFGPNVTIVTPVHPMISSERHQIRTAEGNIRGLCYMQSLCLSEKAAGLEPTWLCVLA